jgi:hypothetical protein
MMKRHVAWIFGAGLMFVGLAAPASAQVRVDIGVQTPHVGARVVVGAPRVVYVPVRHRGPVYARRDVYSRHDYRWDRGRGRGWDRRDREYYKDVREARRDYEKDIREARRDYEKDIREAQRDRRR